MTWAIKRNDLEPAYTGTLYVGGAPLDLTGRTVRFLMRHTTTGELKVTASATVVDATAGMVKYAWAGDDTDTSGLYKAEWEVTDSGRPRTFPSKGYLFISITDDLDDA